MNRIQLWWFHFKMRWIGNKKYREWGGAIIPCQKCGDLFMSYPHWGGYGDTYDNLCEWCEFSERDLREVKFQMEDILTTYDRGGRSWDDTKAYLRAEGIKVGRKFV